MKTTTRHKVDGDVCAISLARSIHMGIRRAHTSQGEHAGYRSQERIVMSDNVTEPAHQEGASPEDNLPICRSATSVDAHAGSCEAQKSLVALCMSRGVYETLYDVHQPARIQHAGGVSFSCPSVYNVRNRAMLIKATDKVLREQSMRCATHAAYSTHGHYLFNNIVLSP